ncbi:AAA family ATPase [Vibrio splendidus]
MNAKSLRAIKSRANRGNIASIFQLFEMFQDGKDIELDLDQSHEYLKKCLQALALNKEGAISTKHPLRLDSISFYDFRRFGRLSFNPKENLSVIIGDNGAGKSSILEGIAKAFSQINNNLIFRNASAQTLEPTDVKVGITGTAEVVLSFELGEETRYQGKFVTASKGFTSSSATDLTEFKSLARLFRRINEEAKKTLEQELDLPLLAFYSVSRSQIKPQLSYNEAEFDMNSRLDVIDKSAIDGEGNVEDFLRWFIYADNLADYDGFDRLDKMKTEVAAYKTILDAHKESGTTEVHPLQEVYANRLSDMNALQTKLNQFDLSLELKRLKSVKDAIISSVETISDIYVERASGKATVMLINSGVHVNFRQASKGQQVYLALIADIARRMAYLNVNLDNLLHGQGIVLIDEVELHLHPSWQQGVIEGLQKTFPNIQFIITTHSPQVLANVRADNIFIITPNDDDNFSLDHPQQAYGLTSNDILNEVMQPHSMPSLARNVVVEERLSNIHRLISDKEYDEATKCINDLEVELNGEIPELLEAKLSIDLASWE